MPRQETPLLLQASFTLPPGQQLGPLTEGLRNPLRTAMWVDEIRFRVGAGSASDAVRDIRARFTLRGRPISNWVHLWGFSRLFDPTNSLVPVFDKAIWRPREPIYVGASDYLTVQLWNSNESGAGATQTAQISYAGRSIAPGAPPPTTLWLPWVCEWLGTPRAFGSDYVTEQSKASDLRNVTGLPLRVQSLIGRMRFATSPTDGDIHQTMYRYASVRIVDDAARTIVRDKTPFGHLFDSSDKSLPMHSMLAADGYYIVQYDAQFAAIAGAGTAQPYISMVGDREIRL